MRARGFTLLETVLVIVIVGVIAAFVAPILSTAVTSYDTTSRNVEVLTRMRYAMERMAREIREVRRDTADDANYDFVAAGMTASKFEFRKGDGNLVTIEHVAPAVRLSYSSPAISAQTLTDKVTGFSFNYCRLDGTTCQSAWSTGLSGVNSSNLEFVEISMSLAGTGTATYSSQMRIELRNPR